MEPFLPHLLIQHGNRDILELFNNKSLKTGFWMLGKQFKLLIIVFL